MWYAADEIRETIAELNLTVPELRICDDSEAQEIWESLWNFRERIASGLVAVAAPPI